MTDFNYSIASACASVVIPTYNEEATVCTVVRRALAQPEVREVIVVDDGSATQLAGRASTPDRKGLCVRAIRHAQNTGKGAALRTGFQQRPRPLSSFRTRISIQSGRIFFSHKTNP